MPPSRARVSRRSSGSTGRTQRRATGCASFLRDVERHWLRYHAITRRARNLDIPRQEQRSWPIWLDRNERLLREGRAILDDPAAHGAHLDRIEDGRERLRSAVSRMERFSSAYRTQSRSRDRGPIQRL